jgi:hypothetical protein
MKASVERHLLPTYNFYLLALITYEDFCAELLEPFLPTVTNYVACVIKIYKAAKSLARFLE